MDTPRLKKKRCNYTLSRSSRERLVELSRATGVSRSVIVEMGIAAMDKSRVIRDAARRGIL